MGRDIKAFLFLCFTVLLFQKYLNANELDFVFEKLFVIEKIAADGKKIEKTVVALQNLRALLELKFKACQIESATLKKLKNSDANGQLFFETLTHTYLSFGKDGLLFLEKFLESNKSADSWHAIKNTAIPQIKEKLEIILELRNIKAKNCFEKFIFDRISNYSPNWCDNYKQTSKEDFSFECTGKEQVLVVKCFINGDGNNIYDSIQIYFKESKKNKINYFFDYRMHFNNEHIMNHVINNKNYKIQDKGSLIMILKERMHLQKTTK